MVFFFIGLCFVSIHSICRGSDWPVRVNKSPVGIYRKKLVNFTYFPQGFYVLSKNPSTVPLITGPASPCCILFVEEMSTHNTLGFHIAHNNSLNSVKNVVNYHFGKDKAFRIALFTNSNEQRHKDFVFKEGSHQKRFLAIFDMMNKEYTVKKRKLYFHEEIVSNSPEDRWVMYVGRSKQDKLKIRMLSAHSLVDINIDAFKWLSYVNSFQSIKTLYNFLEYENDEPLHELDKLDDIYAKSLNDLHIGIFDDGCTILAYNDKNIYHFSLYIENVPIQWPTCAKQCIYQSVSENITDPESYIASFRANMISILIKKKFKYSEKVIKGELLRF